MINQSHSRRLFVFKTTLYHVFHLHPGIEQTRPNGAFYVDWRLVTGVHDPTAAVTCLLGVDTSWASFDLLQNNFLDFLNSTFSKLSTNQRLDKKGIVNFINP